MFQFQPQTRTLIPQSPISYHQSLSVFTFTNKPTPPPPKPQLYSTHINHPSSTMPLPSISSLRKRRIRRLTAKALSPSTADTTVTPPEPNEDDKRKGSDLPTLVRRFWKVAAPYWFSDDKVQARLQLAAVFALTLGTTGISVGFSFLGRDFYNALASKQKM